MKLKYFEILASTKRFEQHMILKTFLWLEKMANDKMHATYR